MERAYNKNYNKSVMECDDPDKPSPLDAENFIPWACRQLQAERNVFCVTVSVHQSMPSASSKGKRQPTAKRTSKHDIGNENSREKNKSKSKFIENSSSSDEFQNFAAEIEIKISLTFDVQHNLTGLKFEGPDNVPRVLFKVLGLMIPFHPHLTTICAYGGIDHYSIYEISKLLNISMICEVCLDGTSLKNPNYYLLLESASNLSCLSLSRCHIDDEILKSITDLLGLQKPCGKILKYLNVSSNKITDTGATYLGNILKTNRHLTFLNVSDNGITDVGSYSIFDSMLPFTIDSEERIYSKLERIKYLKELEVLINQVTVDIRQVEEKKLLKRKGIQGSTRSTKEFLKRDSLVNFEAIIAERAKIAAIEVLGEFTDPFQSNNVFEKNGLSYCIGNNTLTCLNIAYNNLSFVSLLKLLEVLNHQKASMRKPRGLFRVRLEGNNLPTSCEEYAEISTILKSCLDTELRPSQVSSRRNK